MQKKGTKFHLSYLDHAVQGLTPFNEICFSCFTYTVMIRFNKFKRNKLHVSSAVIVTQKMFGYCGWLRAVSLFVNRSAMFVEAVFKSTFGFSYVLFVTVVTLYHVDNVFGVAVNVMSNKSSFASRNKCIINKSVVYVVAC